MTPASYMYSLRLSRRPKPSLRPSPCPVSHLRPAFLFPPAFFRQRRDRAQRLPPIHLACTDHRAPPTEPRHEPVAANHAQASNSMRPSAHCWQGDFPPLPRTSLVWRAPATALTLHLGLPSSSLTSPPPRTVTIPVDPLQVPPPKMRTRLMSQRACRLIAPTHRPAFLLARLYHLRVLFLIDWPSVQRKRKMPCANSNAAYMTKASNIHKA